MAFFHVLALRSRTKTKLVYNRSEAQVLKEFVLPYLQTGTIQTTWGKKVQTVPVADLEVYRTEARYDKKLGVPFETFKRKKKNLFPKFDSQAKRGLSKAKDAGFRDHAHPGGGRRHTQRVFTRSTARKSSSAQSSPCPEWCRAVGIRSTPTRSWAAPATPLGSRIATGPRNCRCGRSLRFKLEPA